jgi:GAF domain-containing protein
VCDASADKRFADSPLVTDDPKIRFYAGFPLTTPDGFNLGALCAIDRRARELAPEQQKAMGALARQVMVLMELRKVSTQLADALKAVRTLEGLLPICAWCKRIRDDGGYWNQIEAYISTHTGAEFTHGICPECLERVRPEPQAS